jgi:hypothetical protein
MDESDFNFDAVLSAMMANITAVPLRALAAEHAAAFEKLAEFDPVKLAATFGGLLTVPELQSSSIRLEALTHLALAMGRGSRKPSAVIVKKVFGQLRKGVAGRAEDPAEDIFVSLVVTPRGNFRVLDGTWESASFFLQRVINTVEAMPNSSGYNELRENIYALLRLSEVVCERAGLERYQLGNDIPEAAMPARLLESLSSLRGRVHFTRAELDGLGVSLDDLLPFIIDPRARLGLLDERIGHTTLERYPVAWRNDDLHLLLPTAVTVAIRRYVIERMEAAGMRHTFVTGMAIEYAEAFARVPLVGGQVGAPLEFRKTDSGLFSGAMIKVERGRYLNFVFFMDTLDKFEDGGLAGYNPAVAGMEADLNAWIAHAIAEARTDPHFRDGMTMFVSCGIGRGAAVPFALAEQPNWRQDFVSAADLYTLSWVRNFRPLSLWRLFEGLDKIEQMGIVLQNINGLLNMVAWWQDLEGHLIPHGQLPDDFRGEPGSTFIMINQNGLRKLRHDVATAWDSHAEQDIHGRWIKVRKSSESEIEEDRAQPLYASEEKPDGRWLPGVFVTAMRPWWCEIEVGAGTEGRVAYQRWQMMTTWLARAAPVLDREFPRLPAGPLLWRAIFEGTLGDLDDDAKQMGYVEAIGLLNVSADATSRVITLVAAPNFEGAHFHEDNIAERALVERLVEGVAAMAGSTLSAEALKAVVNEIVPDNRARQTHMFRTQHFRDYVRASIPKSPVTIDQADAGTLRLGLGWQIRAQSEGPNIQSKDKCLTYLNSLVRHLEDELCTELRLFDRAVLIRMLLRNHEAASVDQDRWMRTAAAVLSLHEDKAAAMKVIANHQFRLNAVFQATRLLAEIAICECPLAGGQIPARTDLSRLMATVLVIQQYGGWSDAMRWNVMKPTLRITPLGDVHAKLGFIDKIIEPFSRAANDVRVHDAVDNYATNLTAAEPRRSVGDLLDRQFLDAWQEETGASLDEMRLFMDYLENMGVEKSSAVFEIRRSALMAIKTDEGSLSEASANAIVNFLTLRSRPVWRQVPAGFEDRDRQPWRFRRRLSVLRKPLLQLDDEEDATFLVTPGLVRDGVVYTIGNYHRGDFPARQIGKAMRIWAGTLRDRMGREFGAEVAAKLKNLGWNTEPEVKITKLLRQGFDRDYGDVDVLAWNPVSGRVLIIECKDVQYRKTFGEISEQLADFRGEIGSDGKPDYLRRHLDRVDIISQHLPAVAAYLGITKVQKVESHLVFRNPVPMEFALQHMAARVTIGLFDRLDKI